MELQKSMGKYMITKISIKYYNCIAHTHTHKQTHTHRHTDTHTQKHTETETYTDTQRERHTHTDTPRHAYSNTMVALPRTNLPPLKAINNFSSMNCKTTNLPGS